MVATNISPATQHIGALMPTSTAQTSVDDIAHGHIDLAAYQLGTSKHAIAALQGRKKCVAVGRGVTVKVNTNIGVSDKSPLSDEMSKIEILRDLPYGPDIIMDHTIDQNNRNFWKAIVSEFDGPVGALPHYTAYSKKTGIEKSALLDRMEEMLSGGIAFMTLHFTADLDLYEVARASRSIPTTSRGGGLVIRDMIISRRRSNVFRDSIDEIIKIFKNYNATISVGTTFRPAEISTALDEAHRIETLRQIEVIELLKSNGVSVLMEGVGHLPLHKYEEYIGMTSAANCPFMPLGPIVTDSAVGFDHVTNAIGGALMAHLGGAHVLNSVTREEHTGGVPSMNSIIEGLKAVRVAAHAVNVSQFPNIRRFDELLASRRGSHVTCVVSGGLFGFDDSSSAKGCDRCSYECPIILAPSAL